MDPFTPNIRAGGARSRRHQLTLSAKQYNKITDTIASVRRTRTIVEDVDDDDFVEQPVFRGDEDREAFRLQEEPSFIAEKSFVSAPLNSRVPRPRASIGATNGKGKGKGKERVEDLQRVPLEVQEALILEDLLFVLMGIEGTYITFPPDDSFDDEELALRGVRFVTSPALDPSLRDLVERILPLATYYTAIAAFIDRRSHLEYGLVNHALCAAIRNMLKDYQTLLSQLEHAFNTSPQFSLQKLWFYVHPTLHTLSLIYGLVTELNSADDPSSSHSSSSSSSDDDSQDERDAALGLGGAKLKAVLSDINGGLDGASAIAVKGGEVLTILHERMANMSGDPAAAALYRALVREAGHPYAQMLDIWMRTGKLSDPYEELCVKESKFINTGTLEMDYTDEYWERRYTLRDGSTGTGGSKRHQAGVPPPRTPGGRLPGGACIPPLLETWKYKVLLAGKYLNVIRECGVAVNQKSQTQETNLSMDDEKFYKSIEDAYTFANRTLLRMLLQDQQLIPRLRSLKHFFFLSQSSFLTHFLDLAHNELKKPAKSVSQVKLQSLLDLALNVDHTVGEKEESYKEDVKIHIASSGLYEWLVKVVSVSGEIEDGNELGVGFMQEEHKKEPGEKDKKELTAMDALSLDYTVKFPLSLVISRKTILRYQLLFRFLLHLRQVEQSLAVMWLDQKSHAWRVPLPQQPEYERWRTRVLMLRTRMLAFVQHILAFATLNVLEPNWRNLEVKLGKVTTVDELLRDHVDFLDTCLKECMLTSSKLLKIYSRLLDTCVMFTGYRGPLTRSANSALGEENVGAKMENRWQVLCKFENSFDHWLKLHLDTVQYYASSENTSLMPLVVRLNSIRIANDTVS